MPIHQYPGGQPGLNPSGNFNLQQLVSMMFAPLAGAITGGAGGAFGSLANAPNFLAQRGATTATGAQNQRGRGQTLQNAASFVPYLLRNVGQGVVSGTQQTLDTATNPNYDPAAAMQAFFNTLYGRRN